MYYPHIDALIKNKKNFLFTLLKNNKAQRLKDKNALNYLMKPIIKGMYHAFNFDETYKNA